MVGFPQALGELAERVERQVTGAVAIQRGARDESAQRPQGLELVRGIELDEGVCLLRGRGPLPVHDDERPRPAGGAVQAQPPEQARVGDGRVRPPRDDEPAAVADLAERGRARADRLVGEARPSPTGRIDDRADRLGERHRLALRLAARLAEAVHERRPRLPQDRGGGLRRLVDGGRAAVEGGDRRCGPFGEPRVAERAGARHAQAPAGDGRLDVVAGAPAPGARRVSHRPPLPRAVRAPRAAGRPAPRGS